MRRGFRTWGPADAAACSDLYWPALVAVVLLRAGSPDGQRNAGPTGDPASDNYSPWVWLNAWGTRRRGDAARAGDVTEGLQHSGMVVAAVPDQLNALTAADKAQLDHRMAGQWPAATHLAASAALVIAMHSRPSLLTKRCLPGPGRIRTRWLVIWVERPTPL